MSENGAFIGSELGAFFESENNERGGLVTAGPAGELFVAYAGTWTWDSNDYEGPFGPGPINVQRAVIEIQRFDGNTGASGGVVFTRESPEYWADTTVEPPNSWNSTMDLRGFERIDDDLYLLWTELNPQADHGDAPEGTWTYMAKLSLGGSGVPIVVYQTETAAASLLDPQSLAMGTQQDGDEEPVLTRLYALGRSADMSPSDDSELMVYTPNLTSDTPIAGLGSTFASRPGRKRISGYHHDETHGGGVKYIYDTGLTGTAVQATQGTSLFEEWGTADFTRIFQITHTTATTPQVHVLAGSGAGVKDIQDGSSVHSLPFNATLGDSIAAWSVRHVDANTADYFWVTGTDHLRGRRINF